MKLIGAAASGILLFIVAGAFGADAAVGDHAALDDEDDDAGPSTEASDEAIDEVQTPELGDFGVRPDSGFEHSLRVGFALPAGRSADGRAMKDDVAHRVPIIVDIGYRASRTWYFALMGMVGVDSAKETCLLSQGQTGDISCTVEGWRVGLEAMVHPLPEDSLDLWIGAGLGWERMEQKVLIAPEEPAQGFGTTLRMAQEGPALELQGGIDIPVASRLSFGPFASYVAGTFVRASNICPPAFSCPSSVDQVEVHHWLTLGMRGTFGP
jgi:hypothetical protein